MRILIRLCVGVLCIGLALYLQFRSQPVAVSPVLHTGDALASFQRAIASEAAATKTPWGMAHGLLAFGPELELSGASGDSGWAVASLERRFRERGSFSLFEPDGTLGEVHPHLVYKTFMEVVAPAVPVASAGDPPHVWDEMGASAVESFRAPQTFEEWNDVAWLIEALARSGRDPKEELGASGLTLEALALGVLEQVEAADRLVEKALADPAGFRRPSGTDPAVSGIWAYTCGGQHLLQGLIVASSKGLLPAPTEPRVAARVNVFLKRLSAEYRFREDERARAIKAGVGTRVAYAETAKAELKLLGHGLETLARARDAGLGDLAQIEEAAATTRAHLLALFQTLVDQKVDLAVLLPRFRAQDPENWHLWFGDGCHALRGLQQWPQ